jgi:gluconate 2-dehydrogenase
MKSVNVLVAAPIPDEAEQVLASFCAYEKWDGFETLTEERLISKLADKDGLYLDGGLRVSRAVIEQSPHLRAVSNASVGYNNFDLIAMKERGIIGTNTPGILDDTVADLVLGLMLSVARRLCDLDRYVKEGQWHPGNDSVHFGIDVHHKTIGIIGMGRIGEAVAVRAKLGFHMNVLYCNRSRKPDVEAQLGVEYASLSDLLGRSDFIVLITPYTKETHQMIGKDQFAQMKKTAVFINVSRGRTVDEKAMIAALQNGTIAGAGLDVYTHEPIESDNPLLQLRNTVTVPHIGAATAQTRLRMALAAVENLRQALAGEKPATTVPELR